eukprot:403350125
MVGLNLMIKQRDYEDAKKPSFIKKMLSFYIGLTRTMLSFVVAIYSAIAAQNLLYSDIQSTAVYYAILLTFLPIILLYGLSLFIAFKVTQMPVQTTKYFWNCVYSKNLYMREVFKIILMLSDTFTTSIRDSKFAIISYFIVVFAIYCLLNIKRALFYDHYTDRVQMYCLRGVLSISYACLVRVIFELQLIELIIFYPIILYVTIQLFQYFEQQKRRKIFDQIETLNSLPLQYIQQIILQVLQMLDRQSQSDLRELQNIFYRHRMNCFNTDCVCNKYYHTIVSNFKDDIQIQDLNNKTHKRYDSNDDRDITERNNSNDNNDYLSDGNETGSPALSRGNQMINEDLSQVLNNNEVEFSGVNLLKNQDIDMSRDQSLDGHSSHSTQNNRGFPSYLNQKVPWNSKKSNYKSLIIRHSSDGSTVPPLNQDPNIAIVDGQLDDMHLLHADDIDMEFDMKRKSFILQNNPSSNKIDNFTFAFDSNHVVQGLNIEDLFKDVSAIEIVNQKLFDLNNNQQQSTTKCTILIEDMKFDSARDARKYVFVWLFEQIFKQYEGNQNSNLTNDNIEFELLYINFINQNLKKHFLAIFQLLRIYETKLNLKFFDKLLFSVSEILILEEAIANFKNYFGGFDYSLFIEGNQQAIELDNNYEKTTNNILEFWQKFKGENIKIQQILDLGIKISKNVNNIKKFTKKQEESYAIRKDLSKYQLYARFHLQMLHDPSTFNQMAQYLKNSLVFKTRKFLGHDSGGNEDSVAQIRQEQMDEKGICISEGWSNTGQKGNLKFLFGNKTFCDMFRTSQQQLPGADINGLMPESIRDIHGDLIYRFYTENKPTILGSMRIQYAKTFDGYILPIKMRINFYYHPEFKYSFFAQFERIASMNMFNEEQTKIPVEDCILIMTDESLHIQHFSQNFITFSGVSKNRMKLFEENTGNRLKLTDIVIELQSVLKREFGETLLPEQNDLSLVNQMVRCKKYSEADGHFSDLNAFACILTYTQQALSYGQKRVNIFMLVPLSRHPDFDGMTSSNNMYSSKMRGSAQVRKNMLESQMMKIENSENDINDLMESLNSDEQNSFKSMMSRSSASSNTSSGTSTSGAAFYAKNLLFQNSAPKVIKINLALVVAMIVGFFVISIYNLAIFLNKHSFIKGRFDTYSYISQRNARMRASLLDLKMIHQIVQNQKNLDYSEIFGDQVSRLDFYFNDLEFNLEQVRKGADQFNQFMMSNQDHYSFDLQFENITFISEKGNLYTQDVSFKHSINLFISYCNEIKKEVFLKEKPLLNVAYYDPVFAKANKALISEIKNRLLTALEQNLYFIFENGMYQMSQLGQRQSYMLSEVSTKQTDEGIEMLNISTFVSIGIVTLIGIIIFPLVSKIIERQYSVIRFFNYLDNEAIGKIIEDGSSFQKQLQIRIGKSRLADYESKLEGSDDEQSNSDDEHQNGNYNPDFPGNMKIRSKIIKSDFKIEVQDLAASLEQQVEGNQKQSVADKLRQAFQKSKLQKTGIAKQTDEQQAGKSMMQNIFGKNPQKNMESKKISFKNLSALDKNNEASRDINRSRNNSNVSGKSKKGGKSQNKNLEEKKQETPQKYRPKETDKTGKQIVDDESQSDEEKNKRRDKKKKKAQDEAKLDDQSQKQNELDKSKNQQILAEIAKLAFKKRFRICFLIAVLIMYLNASLLVTFFQSQTVFTNDKDSAMRMSKFYQREECAYNLPLFMREKIIRNFSLPIEVYTDSNNLATYPAVSYFIDKCFKNELEIQQMRKNMPDYLQESAQELEGFENQQLCDLTYEYSSTPEKAATCKTAMDNLLNKGIGNTMYYIIGYIQQMNFNHESPLSQSQAYLTSLLEQKKMQDICDILDRHISIKLKLISCCHLVYSWEPRFL